ncbi:MAG: hypothetical protein IJT95_07015 [Abditibacteriota bacterium]|nr:hypothetical protein [Abditibacteriota bacterium]
MKRIIVLACLLLFVFSGSCFCQAKKIKSVKDIVGEGYYNSVVNYKDIYANDGWSIFKYTAEGKDYNKILEHPEFFEEKHVLVPMASVPVYLRGIYKDGEGLYSSIIYSYNESIDDSHMVMVYQDHFGGKKPSTYDYLGDSFISLIDNDIENAIKRLPVVQRAILHDRFECILYDAAEYGADYYFSNLLTVVKDNGKVIWYDRGSELGDVAITSDGRYMIACVDCTYYVTVTKDRIISELYAGERRLDGQMKWEYMPVSCRILTDNIVRLEYKDGCIEHWRVRLSDEDIRKNREKWEKVLIDRGIKNTISAGSKHLVWCNGEGKGYVYKVNEESWDYSESKTEPVYKEIIDMSKMKEAEVSGAIPAKAYEK